MKKFRIDFKKLLLSKSIFKKIPWFFGRHAFLVILFFVVLSLVLGASLFYNYIIIVEQKDPKINNSFLNFKKDTYQKIIRQWQANEQNSDQSENAEYQDPFLNQ